jgi:hypothetical protein
MMIDVSHHHAEIRNDGRRASVPGFVGSQKTKSPLHRARDRLFNEALARVWARKIRDTDTRYRIILKIPPDMVATPKTP